MLYHLLYPCKDWWGGFNVLRYITVRAAGAAFTAFAVVVVAAPFLIRIIKRMNVYEDVSKPCVPQLERLHDGKKGTPTMGGVIMLLGVMCAVGLWGNFSVAFVPLGLFVAMAGGAVGMWDDLCKLRYGKRGLPKRYKLLLETGVALVVAVWLWVFMGKVEGGRFVQFPFFKTMVFDLGVLYILFVCVVMVGATNAVNLADGLDGLAVGCSVMVGIALMVITYVVGRADASRYLWLIYVPGAGELAVFGAAVVGGALGFLWYNCHPAAVFMGDTGSLFLGSSLGYMAVVAKQELLLFMVGGVFVAEAVSVIVQVLSVRLFGRRVFRVAPLHHHFQLAGWHENRVVVRFWIVSALLAVAALCTLKLR